MNPSARSRLAAASRRYLAAAPWNAVTDAYQFGLHDRTSGQFGCAAVMGAGGMEYGLTIAMGVQGFSLFQKLQDDELDYSTMMAKTSSVAFSITNVAPASRAYKRLQPLIIDTSKVKEPTRGYLTGWRLVPGQEPRPLDSEEALLLARCLEAVAELAETGRLGTAEARDGSRTLFFNLTEEAGKLRIRQSYRRLEEVDVQHPPVELPQPLLERLKKRSRVEARYMVSIFTPPVSVQGGIVWMGLLLDEENRPVLAHAAPEFGEAALAVFEALAGKTSVKEAKVGVPREIWTDSYPVFAALQDAMLALEIRFLSREEVPELQAAKESLSGFLTR